MQNLTSSASLSFVSQHKAGSYDRSTASACKDSLQPNLNLSKVHKRFQPNEGSSFIQIFKTILVPEKTSQETLSSKISPQPDQACTLGPSSPKAPASVDVLAKAVLVDLNTTTPSVSVVSSSKTKPSTTKKQSERIKPSWNCSEAQKEWMMGELNELGLYPGTANYSVSQCCEGKSLWRYPPPAELQKYKPTSFPTPCKFQIHPMFIWSPEILCSSVCPVLLCLSEKCKGSAMRKGLGRPLVVVGGDGGQYYIFATELKCNSCGRSTWYSDNPEFISRLSEVLQNMLPAYITYRKAVDWKIVHKIHRTGRSPADVANEINEFFYLQYKCAHPKYLLVTQSIHEKFKKGTSLDKFVGFDDEQPSVSFGGFQDVNGWNGVLVSSEFI